MKKNFLVICICMLSLFVVGCNKKIEKKDYTENKQSDALRFKEEYEKINGTINSNNGKQYRTINIDENNKIVYVKAEDIVKMIGNKETFVVYFGYSTCPWCRSVITNLIDVSNKLNIDKIYYVDVKEIRDVLSVDENGNVVTTKEGSEDYYKLIKLLSNVLSDYKLSDSEGNSVKTDEKRIYAPNVISVVKGEARTLESGISEGQNDAYMELTEEMKEETTNKFIKVITDVLDDSCGVNEMC